MSRIPIRLSSRNKYGAKRTNGYDSKKEAKRAFDLELLQRIGEIQDLERQKEFVIVPKDEMGPALKYRCDFFYWHKAKTEWVCEDVKGVRTPLYRLKRRLMFAVHGIKVLEI